MKPTDYLTSDRRGRDAHDLELEAQWQEETPLVIEEEVWDAVRVDEMLTDA